jgi:hypothetical protein
MSAKPKLRIKLPHQQEAQEICTIEDAQYRFNWGHEPFLIIVEGKSISSFDELIELTKQEHFEGRDFLNVEIQPLLAGG